MCTQRISKYNFQQWKTRLFSTNNLNTYDSAITGRLLCIFQEEEHRFGSVTEDLSHRLSIPILTPDGITDVDDNQQFTHRLCLVPYLDGDGIVEESEQYALAIQPLITDESSKKQKNKKKKSAVPKMKPFWIDFCPSMAGKRSGQPDMLLHAIAPQRVGAEGAIVYDLTAGWGQDSLQMALGGAKNVHMVERDPIVAILLQDALRRVNLISQSNKANRSWQERASKLSETLTLQQGDSKEFLANLVTADGQMNTELLPPADIIYLDPMFPPRTKSAAVKKGMQILHGLFDDGEEATGIEANDRREQEEVQLLKLAHGIAKARVVVKRPIHAPELGSSYSDLKPTNVIKGSTNRFDVYVTNTS